MYICERVFENKTKVEDYQFELSSTTKLNKLKYHYVVSRSRKYPSNTLDARAFVGFKKKAFGFSILKIKTQIKRFFRVQEKEFQALTYDIYHIKEEDDCFSKKETCINMKLSHATISHTFNMIFGIPHHELEKVLIDLGFEKVKFKEFDDFMWIHESNDINELERAIQKLHSIIVMKKLERC